MTIRVDQSDRQKKQKDRYEKRGENDISTVFSHLGILSHIRCFCAIGGAKVRDVHRANHVRHMELAEIVRHLAAAAAADAPIDGRERDLMRHLLRDFGATHAQSESLVDSLPQQFAAPTTTANLHSRSDALKLLRGLLVISYSDGTFDQEELPFLAPIVDAFSITKEELTRARLQALLYLRLEPSSIELPFDLIESEHWEAATEFAHRRYQELRQAFQSNIQRDLNVADAETCYLAMAVGAPSFDTSYTKERFLQSHPDFFHSDDLQGLQMLRDEAQNQLLKQWEAAYVSRCNFCYLEAPGKRRDLCPRCKGEYGVAARR